MKMIEVSYIKVPAIFKLTTRIRSSKPIQSLTVNIVKAFGALVLVKIVALAYGPASVASLSNFQNILGLLSILLTLSCQTGLTISIAKDNTSNAPLLILLKLVLILSPIAAIAIYGLSGYFVLKTDVLSAGDYFLYSILIMIPFSANILLVACEVAHQRYSNILFNYLVVGFTPVVYFIFNQDISFQYLLISMAIGNWTALLYVLFKIDFKIKCFYQQALDISVLKPLMQYGIMSGLLGLMTTIVALVTRSLLSSNFDAYTAGLWDALLKFSILFQFLIATPLITTALPLVASNLDKNSKLLYVILARRLILILLITMISLLLSYFFADFLILLLYSEEFLAISSLVVFMIGMEGLKGLAGIFWLVPLTSKRFGIGIFNNFLYMLIIVAGLYILDCFSQINLFNIALLYLVSSLIYLIVIFVWFILWLGENKRKFNAL